MNKILFILAFLTLYSCELKRPKKDLFESQCKKNNYYVFINGMNVNAKQASISENLISIKTNKKFELLYNYTEGAHKDLLQAIRQKVIENSKEDIFSLAKLFSKILSDKDEDVYTSDEIKEIKRVSRELESKKTLIVSHSQGNLFANKICRESTNKPKVIHVANPSSLKTECEITSITFKNDPVIEAVRKSTNDLGITNQKIREADYFFKKGNSITSLDGFNGDETFINKVFYNHDFESYLVREPTSSKKILGEVAKYKEPKDSIAFRVTTSKKSGFVITETDRSFSNHKTIKCSEILNNEIIRIKSFPSRIVVIEKGIEYDLDASSIANNYAKVTKKNEDSDKYTVVLEPRGLNELMIETLKYKILGIKK